MVFIGLINTLLVIYSFGFVSADSQCALSPERALAAAKQLQTSLKKDGSYKVDIGYSKWFMTFNGMGPEVRYLIPRVIGEERSDDMSEANDVRSEATLK